VKDPMKECRCEARRSIADSSKARLGELRPRERAALRRCEPGYKRVRAPGRPTISFPSAASFTPRGTFPVAGRRFRSLRDLLRARRNLFRRSTPPAHAPLGASNQHPLAPIPHADQRKARAGGARRPGLRPRGARQATRRNASSERRPPGDLEASSRTSTRFMWRMNASASIQKRRITSPRAATSTPRTHPREKPGRGSVSVGVERG